MAVPKILNIELPNDPTISLLGIYPKELKSGSKRDICTPMFITLFTISKRWKQPKCPLTGEWWLDKQNVLYAYDGKLFSLKEDWNSDTFYKLYETWRRYAKWNKPDTKG